MSRKYENGIGVAVHFYWGEDEFSMERAIAALSQRVLDPTWVNFNYDKISPDQPDAIIQALNQAMTPPFGSGSRLVWLMDTSLGQRCSEELLAELERTLPHIPETNVLLITARSKPDGRLKSTKLLQKYASIQEFSPISGWKMELLVKQVQQATRDVGVQLTAAATELLAESVGSNTRQLYNELEKLRLYAGDSKQPLNEGAIAALVTATNQNTLQLAAAIRQGQVTTALELVADLLRQNQPALAIVKTLVGQFRLWLWVRLMLDTGERNDSIISQEAELANPKRLYFLKKEIESLSLPTLLRTLPVLLELELSLKSGAEEGAALQTRVIELCTLCQSRR
jgi:DNA polymerase-3 subunit delta